MKSRSLLTNYAAVFSIGVALVGGAGQALAQRPLGIDVSSYQGSGVNWTSVKSSGVVFAWAKATEGTYDDDADFTINENNGKAAGVYMGAYDFCRPDLYSPATEESFFWSYAGAYIKADGKTFMPMLDFETFNGTTGDSTYSAWANDWCGDVVVSAGNVGVSIKPFIYSSSCNFGNFNSTISQWFSDIANYGSVDGDNAPQTGTPWSSCLSDDPWGGGAWDIWQYASAAPDGTVPGVSGACDVDVYNGTFTQLTNKYLAIANGNGAIYYWDPQAGNTGNPYTGSMTGTWENNDWDGNSVPTPSPIAWVEGKAACFGVNTGTNTPAYTVTMNTSHLVAGFFDGGLGSPKACNVTVTGIGSVLLTSGAQAFDIKNGSDGSSAILTFNNSIGGTGQLTAEDNGQGFLNAANSYSGGTALGYSGPGGPIPFSGTLNFNNSNAFGTGTITLQSAGTGSTLTVEGTSAITIPNSVSVSNSTTNIITGNAAGLTFSGPWSVGGTFEMGTGTAAGDLVTISGAVSGTAAWTKYQAGILTLSGVNTYSGPITISAGTFGLGGTGQLHSGAYASTIANSGTFSYGSTAAQTLSGIISGAGTLGQSAGSLTLSAANTYTGFTTINGGTLTLGVNNAIPSASTVQLANGAIWNMNGKSDSIATLCGPLGATLPHGNITNDNVTLTINGTAVANSGEDGVGAYSGVISGTGGLTLSGGETTLSGSNIYLGNTLVNAGILVPSYNGTIPAVSPVTVNSPGTLDLVGVNETLGSLSGSGTVNLESGTLTAGTANATTTFTGVIQNAPVTYNNGASVNGLQGFYFPNANFTGTPVLRTDATVNFPNLATNTQPLYPQTTEFSVRWLGQLLTTSAAGTYTFTTTSDDGTRLWVNGQLVVDSWAFQGATARGGTITLAANTEYDLRLEYEQGTAGAECLLAWTPPGGSSAIIPNANLFTHAGVGGLTKAGTGKMTLGGVNTYAGPTTISAGTLALSASGSINNSPALAIAAGGTFDVSAFASYTLGGGASLSASGNVSPAIIYGGTTFSLGSQPITLTYDGSHPALTIAQGTLSLNGNAFTVNGAELGGGVYTLIQQTTGTIASSGTFSLSGTAIPPGATAAVSVTGGSVILTISDTTATTIGALAPITYGQTVNLTALITPPANGGTVQFFDNSTALGGPVGVSAGTAALATNGLAAGTHPITASYSGDAYDTASSTIGSSNLVINPAPLTVTANAESKPYGATLVFGPGSTNFTASGLTIGDIIDSITLTDTQNGGPLSAPVGNYLITPSAATGVDFLSSNYSITYNPGTLTVTQPSNTIPVTIISGAMLTNGTFQLNFTGTPGYVYTVEAATNLTPPIPWVSMGTVAADTNGNFSFIDSTATNYGTRFYQTTSQ